jgi:tetratricopeptide (TPR) repeat protein
MPETPMRWELESEVPDHLRRVDAWSYRGLATLAAAEGSHQEALQLARRAAYRSGCDGCTGNQIARSFEAMGQVDSAIVAWENLLRPPTFGSEFNHWRSVELPLAYRRVGELYETRGDRSLAADRYAAFVDLWENADPELQPAVTEVRERLAFMSGEE